MRRRVILGVTFLAALIVFAAVQDRVTAAGARRYVMLQRSALAGRGAPVTIEEVMAPAIRRSVREALAWSGGVILLGVLGSWFLVPGSWFLVPGSRRE